MINRFLEYLFSLKHVRITGGTHLDFASHHPALITLGVIVLAVLGYLSYRPQAASPRKKLAMGIVRALLLVTVFLLVWRPQLVMEHDERTRSTVAVWVDSSSSMQLEDPYSGPKTDAAMKAFLQHVAGGPATGPAAAPGAGGGGGSDRPERYEVAAAALSDTGWLKEVVDVQDVAFFSGSAHAQPLGTAHSAQEIDALVSQVRTIKPEGDTTDVPAVVREILEREQGQRVSAIVLLTDGQTTEKGSRGDRAAAMASQANTKLLAVAVGQEDEPFDLKISPPRLPESTFVKDPVSAKIHISGTGITQATPARITVTRKGGAGEGTPLATKEIVLDPTKRELDTEIPLKLEKKEKGKGERFDLAVRIDPIAAGTQELYRNNNEATGSVTVLDAQINVLYVEGYPRWEFRYLKNELIREPTVNVSTLLTSADDDFTQDADPPMRDKQTGEETFPGSIRHFPDTTQDLNKYDVILLGDVEPTFFSPTQQRLIVDWVKTRGGGLEWIAGPSFNPEYYRGTPMEVLLPIQPDEMDPRARVMLASNNSAYTPVITAAGKETNLFRFFDDPESSWKQVADLPKLYWYKPVQGLKPGAIVLAVHPERTLGGNPAPLLVMRQYGAGPVIFSAYADTWRWRNYTGEPLFQSYWLQMCRLLYANKALGQSKRLELATENPRVEIGKPLKVTLTVKDPTLAGQLPAEVPVILTDRNGQSVETVNLTRAAGTTQGAAESLEGTTTASRIGDFTLAVRPGSLPVEIPPVELTIERPQQEFENVTTNVAGLRTLTGRTSGKVVFPYQTGELAKEIPDRSIPVVMSEVEPLWDKPFALVLVVLLASVEWLIRKSAGLI